MTSEAESKDSLFPRMIAKPAILIWRFALLLAAAWFLPGLLARMVAIALAAILIVAVATLMGGWLWSLICLPKRRDEGPLNLSPDEASAAFYAFRGYGNPPDGILRYVERFWLEGGVFGFVDGTRKDTVYVVFRGTSEIGNWFLTNAQAHMVRAREVFCKCVPGGVHNGFVKAFEDLWLDKSRTERRDPAAPAYTVSKFAWPLPYGTAFSAIFVRWPCTLPEHLQEKSALVVVFAVFASLVLVQRFFAWGRFEDGFRRRDTLRVGPALSKHVTGAETANVVFTGHSLGGALATLAFVDYCLKYPERRTTLVTFGAPRAGNDAFLTWLRDRNTSGGVSVTAFADVGDPVPYMPPSSGFLGQMAPRCTWLSALLVGIYVIGWLPYAIAYKAHLGGGWRTCVRWSGSEGISPSRHFAYLTASMRSELVALSNRQSSSSDTPPGACAD